MKTYTKCLQCFERQASDACRMLGLSETEQERIFKAVRQKIYSFSQERSPVEMGADIHALVRTAADVNDPYADIKRQSNDVCRSCMLSCNEEIAASTKPFKTAVKIAIAGNVIDFGAYAANRVERSAVVETVKSVLSQPLTGDTPESLRKRIMQAKRVLYIGDNAGECFFDRLLLERIPLNNLRYAVRGGPVLNDATIEDAKAAGIDNICPVIDTGSRIPGVIPERCSDEFYEYFDTSDLVIAKGQGNYESLSGRKDRTYAFLTKVKCDVIARDTGYPQGSSVIEIVEPVAHSNKRAASKVDVSVAE